MYYETEVLSRILLKEEQMKNVNGIKIARIAPAITNLMVTYDLMPLCNTN